MLSQQQEAGSGPDASHIGASVSDILNRPMWPTKGLSHQGKILQYDEKKQSGFIKAFDKAGGGYGFSMADWQSKVEKPRVNMIVNFDVIEVDKIKKATCVRVR
jgi:hypothetical protein